MKVFIAEGSRNFLCALCCPALEFGRIELRDRFKPDFCPYFGTRFKIAAADGAALVQH